MFIFPKPNTTEGYNQMIIAYLYGILTSSNEMDRKKLMSETESLVSDGYDLFISNLSRLMTEKYHLLLKEVIENVRHIKKKKYFFILLSLSSKKKENF
jgi:hypothetical protein